MEGGRGKKRKDSEEGEVERRRVSQIQRGTEREPAKRTTERTHPPLLKMKAANCEQVWREAPVRGGWMDGGLKRRRQKEGEGAKLGGGEAGLGGH